MLESPFNRLAGFKACNFLEKGLQHRCFPVNIAKHLRTLILMKICTQLLLHFLLLTVNISYWGLVSALNSIGLLQRCSSSFKEFSLGCLVVGSSLIWKKEKLVEMVTRCHSLSLVVPLCHSLLFVVTRCTTHSHSLYHSLSFAVIRCHSLYHSLSLDVPLVCFFISGLIKTWLQFLIKDMPPGSFWVLKVSFISKNENAKHLQNERV